MKLIFDKDSNGTQELVDALGLIDARTDFSKWKPYIPLSVRRLSAIIGQEEMCIRDSARIARGCHTLRMQPLFSGGDHYHRHARRAGG